MTVSHLDENRLAAVHATGLLDSPPEEPFDRLTRLARRVLETPVALMTLVDADRQYNKSVAGPDGVPRELPLRHSFCRDVVERGEPLVLDDTREDGSHRAHDAVRDLGVLAYAGAPVRTREGHVLGTLCVAAHEPRRWTADHVAVLRDLAAAAATEVQLREALRRERREQAERLEATRRLAASLGHDFNNLLGVIVSATELVRETGDAGDLDAVLDAAGRATRLCGELLVLSDHQPAATDDVDVADLASDTVELMRTSLAGVALCVEHAGGALSVRGDRGQLERVLVNLLINARDALPAGGVVRVTLARAELDAGAAPPLGLAPGSYARLRVIDDGVGMTADVRRRACDAFFTTKPNGSGTGLGLAGAQWIVAAAGGNLDLRSAPGAGTTVEIHLPLADAPDDAVAAEPPGPPRVPVVLLVEDEDSLRRFSRRVLERGGYAVLSAADVQGALDAAAVDPPDVLVTDVVMPGGSGAELMSALRGRRPDLGAVFMSGYGEGVMQRYGVSLDDARFLHKPFRADALLAAVHGALPAERPGSSAAPGGRSTG